MKSIWIIVPLFNEESNVDHVVSEIAKVVATQPYHWTLFFVDDGSKDRTWEKVESVKEREGLTVSGLRLTRNFGKEAALLAGIENLPNDIDAVMFMDADLQHPPQLIPELVKAWEMGDAKIIEGVKRSRGRESILYRLLSNLFYSIIGWSSQFNMSNSSDFKLLDQSVIHALLAMPERNIFFRGMTAWSGFPSSQVEFDVQERREGDRSMSLKSRIRLALLTITSFTTAPLRLIMNIAFLFIILSIFFAIYTVYQKVMGFSVEGFTTVIILELFIGGILLLALGIIGNYLACIYEEVRQRPRYLLLETKNLPKKTKD